MPPHPPPEVEFAHYLANRPGVAPLRRVPVEHSSARAEREAHEACEKAPLPRPQRPSLRRVAAEWAAGRQVPGLRAPRYACSLFEVGTPARWSPPQVRPDAPPREAGRGSGFAVLPGCGTGSAAPLGPVMEALRSHQAATEAPSPAPRRPGLRPRGRRVAPHAAGPAAPQAAATAAAFVAFMGLPARTPGQQTEGALVERIAHAAVAMRATDMDPSGALDATTRWSSQESAQSAAIYAPGSPPLGSPSPAQAKATPPTQRVAASRDDPAAVPAAAAAPAPHRPV